MLNSLDPVVLFFILGVVAGLVKSGLKIPVDFFNTVSIYLLLAIGVKGGIEIAHVGLLELARPALVVLGLGILLTFLAFLVVRKLGKWDLPDAICSLSGYSNKPKKLQRRGICPAFVMGSSTSYLSQPFMV